MKFKVPYWGKVHTILVKNQNLIKTTFLICYTLGFVFITSGFFLYSNNLKLYLLFLGANSLFATLAMMLFSLTLLPGIFQRFKVFPLVSASITLFRRETGILMFIVAMVHSFYITTIPVIMEIISSSKLSSFSLTEILGSISLMILLPVWLTSNDFSQKRLGKFWKTLQRLTYFALIFIFLHVAQTSSKKGLLLLIVLTLEFMSWIKFWFFNKKVVRANQVDQAQSQ